MARIWPLFEEPAAARDVALSLMYSTPSYRVDCDTSAEWTRLRTTADCDECLARQQEPGPRFAAQHQRAIGKKILKLCNVHAELWRERDTRDSGVRR